MSYESIIPILNGANAYVAAVRPFKIAGIEYSEVILLYLKKTA